MGLWFLLNFTTQSISECSMIYLKTSVDQKINLEILSTSEEQQSFS